MTSITKMVLFWTHLPKVIMENGLGPKEGGLD